LFHVSWPLRFKAKQSAALEPLPVGETGVGAVRSEGAGGGSPGLHKPKRSAGAEGRGYRPFERSDLLTARGAAPLERRKKEARRQPRSNPFSCTDRILRRLSDGGVADDLGGMDLDNPDISYFGHTNHHAVHRPFGIKQADRLSHMYIIGKTGTGKSTLLQTLAMQDAVHNRGFALIDPHGDLAERIHELLPEQALSRVRYLDATDPRQPFGYNPVRRVRADKIPLAVSGLLETLRKLWPDAWGVRMEHVLRNSLYTLIERDGSTLPDILTLFADDKFRKSITRDTKNETVRESGIRNSRTIHRVCEPMPARRSRTSLARCCPILPCIGSS
jgi:hypothetical protein